jgi:hypothetical protein
VGTEWNERNNATSAAVSIRYAKLNIRGKWWNYLSVMINEDSVVRENGHWWQPPDKHLYTA